MHKTLRIDVSNEDQLKGLSLGEVVTVTVKGKVKQLESPRMGIDFEAPSTPGKPEKKRKIPGEAVLDIQSLNISSSNEFADLLDDDDLD